MPRSPDDYGRVLPTRRWRGPARRPWWQRWLLAWRPWLMLALLLLGWQALDRWWQVAPAPLAGTPQRIATQFHRCGTARGPNCVIDGDTFVMGQRHFRIVGIDAPEIGTKARCPQEAALAESAAAQLLRLLNVGPFVLQPPSDGLRDEYGRELAHVTRTRPDGTSEDLAEVLVASGAVRAYGYGSREPWC